MPVHSHCPCDATPRELYPACITVPVGCARSKGCAYKPAWNAGSDEQIIPSEFDPTLSTE
eukprot:7376954-Prymnesium_polylepis.1